MESALVGALSTHQQGAAKFLMYLEAVVGIELAYTALWAAALFYKSIR